MAELGDLAKKIKTAKEEEIPLDHRGDFYAELSERFMDEKRHLDELLKARKSVLDTLANIGAEKQTKAFTSLKCPAIDDPTEQIASVIEAINKIITEHNSRTAEFDKKRQEAFAKLEKHYAASFVRDQKYNEALQQIADLKTAIAEQDKKLYKLDTEIRALEKELSEASQGAERINDLLFTYFGKDDLRIKVSADKQFQIFRGDIIAKNLSEGEETAIAFAYFIARVQDGRHPLCLI